MSVQTERGIMNDDIFDQKPGEFDKIHEVDLKERMETFYIDYAMSVIAARALPDVSDGLKPVQIIVGRASVQRRLIS